MIIPDVKQMREWDAATLSEENISSLQLMERAAQQCADWLIERYDKQQKIFIVCGKGNNGGDGVAIARLLYKEGYQSEIYIADWDDKESSDFEANLEKLQQTDAPITFIKTDQDFPAINTDTLVIEALFGFGLSRKMEDKYASLVEHINGQKANVISIDVPAGMFTDATSKGNIIIQASHTLTFQVMKLCFLLPENADFFGDVHVLPIGLSKTFASHLSTKFVFTDQAIVSSFYKTRKKFSHKGTYGHALLVAGNEGKMGAAVMCATACLRSGVGLLTCSVPPSDFAIIHIAVPEAMVVSRGNEKELSSFSVIGAGPGLGKEEDMAILLYTMITQFKKPMVIDADALNILSEHPDWMNDLPKGSVLTPHPKEFGRLFGESKDDFDNINKAITAAKKYQIIIVLKGTYTLITDGERNYFNSTGNNGMATGGSGDILTGLITGLLSQKYMPFEAAVTGVYLHGLAADLCLKEQSFESLLPMDVVSRFGAAFNWLQNKKGA